MTDSIKFDSKKGQGRLGVLRKYSKFFFFGYLAASHPTSGHYQEAVSHLPDVYPCVFQLSTWKSL